MKKLKLGKGTQAELRLNNTVLAKVMGVDWRVVRAALDTTLVSATSTTGRPGRVTTSISANLLYVNDDPVRLQLVDDLLNCDPSQTPGIAELRTNQAGSLNRLWVFVNSYGLSIKAGNLTTVAVDFMPASSPNMAG